MRSFTRSITLAVALPVVVVLVAGALIIPAAAAPSTNASVSEFQQCANDASPSTATDCPGGWINGILNTNNSHYMEDQSVPQHAVLSISAGSQTGRTLTIKYQTLKGGIHAYDSLASWDYTQTGLSSKPCDGVDSALCAGVTPSTYLIPAGSAGSHALPDGDRQMRLYGGTITGITFGGEALPTSGDASATVTVTYDLPVDPAVAPVQVLFLWGGHTAASEGPRGWGAGLGSGAISGGPYHMRVTETDGVSVGNRDNQIMGGGFVTATATSTPTGTPTNTPTSTSTATPTSTSTATATPASTSTATATPTSTSTATATPTSTSVPEEPTNTPVPPTATPTNTSVPEEPTNTPVPPTATPTNTPVPPTPTSAGYPDERDPAVTSTPVPPPVVAAVAAATPPPPPVPPTLTPVPPTPTAVPPTVAPTEVPQVLPATPVPAPAVLPNAGEADQEGTGAYLAALAALLLACSGFLLRQLAR